MSNPALSRGFSPDNGRSAPGQHQVKKMKAIHKRIAEGVAQGKKDTEIAEENGVSTQMVSYTRKSPIVKQYLGLVEGAITQDAIDVGKEINELSVVAVKTLERIMCNPGSDPKLQTKIAQDMLDRAGYGAVKKVATANLGRMQQDDLDKIHATALQRAQESGIVAASGDEDIDEAEVISE